MYEKSSEQITNRINEAKLVVNNYMKMYDNIIIQIGKFVSENDIIVKDIKDYFFDLYTNDMFNLPNKLADTIYEYDPIIAKNIMVNIKIYKYNCSISINNITFVIFTYLNAEIRSNILNYTCLYAGFKYKCFGPEIKLINIYSDLVNPVLIDSWKELFELENDLSKEIISSLLHRINSFKNNNNERIEGSAEKVYFSREKVDFSREKVDFSKEKVDFSKEIPSISDQMAKYYLNSFSKPVEKFNTDNISFINKFISNDRHILVGPIAVNLYKGIYSYDRIQIVTKINLTDEIEYIKNIFSNIRYNIINLRIPINLNLYKLSIFLENEHLIDIYNAANFELIPFNTIKYDNREIAVGSPFVILRFRLMDLWNTLYNINTNIIGNAGYYIIYKIINEYIDLRKIMDNMSLHTLFPINYKGSYENIQLSKERIAFRLKDRYMPPYIPHNKKIKNEE